MMMMILLTTLFLFSSVFEMSSAAATIVTDPSSYANTKFFILDNFHLDLTADFSTSTLSGKVTLNFNVVNASDEIILDVRNLDVHGVADTQGNALEWRLGDNHAALGSPLHVKLPSSLQGSSQVSIVCSYATTKKSEAIQFLSPEQTAGKVHPFLFTQCQAIHARSMFPCQDTPSVKSLYTASITVPRPLTALMSAESTGNETKETTTIFSFSQKVRIPSYLVALVVGELESREIGPRSRVWSEPKTVDAGAFEFAETESFIAAGEHLLTPYVWGRYDILLLPPSFPYGGMENPLLTFVTPTLLAGDRSLANVVAHEIAHSWMGNLVTSATWEHFWLNEGFTVFTERKIQSRLYGEPTAEFHAMIGYRHLHEDIAHFGVNHAYTALVPKLDGVDPDDAFSSVPYEKGFNFLYYLQRVVGGAAVFEPFLRAWVEAHAHTSVTTDTFRSFFAAYFEGKPSSHPKHPTAAVHPLSSDVTSQIDWDAWLHGVGYVPVEPKFDTSLADVATQVAEQWIEGNNVEEKTTSSWSSNQWLAFLDAVAAHQESKGLITAERLGQLDAALGIGKSKNSEIMLRWQKINLAAGRAEIVDSVVGFITGQGRMKFVRPLYRELHKSSIPGAAQIAVDTFKKHQLSYHPIAQKMVAVDLGLN